MRRSALRAALAPLVRWPAAQSLEPGCTAIIGMCSRLPQVIEANARCLHAARWPELRRVVIAVDSKRGALEDGLEARVRSALGDLPCEFVYYTPAQARVADALRLPYVYAWLSWAIAIGRVETESLLIHDYDALVLGDALARRYRAFVETRSRMQGVKWYDTNGLVKADRLATTFEAFVDTRWVREFAPIQLFNQVGRHQGRRVDFDILLELQAKHAAPAQRTVVEMRESELTHPSQMIHQYTMFRRQPGAAQPCYSLPMIPFFAWLGGHGDALSRARERLASQPFTSVDFFGDGVSINFSQLRHDHVDWQLKQMLQACVSLRVLPSCDLVAYGDALYATANVAPPGRWQRHFLADQLAWVEAARA